jgi:hypothetical protein
MPLPETYYAKIQSRGVRPLDWDRRGWTQLRDWADRLWYGYFSPVLALGLTGARGWRPILALSVVAVCAASLLWPGTDDLRALALWPHLPPPPEVYRVGRIALLAAAGVLLPLLSLGTRAAPIRLLCGWTLLVALAFSVDADGDWMGGYRWMSLGMPAFVVLFAVGATELLDLVEARTAGGSSWGNATWLAASLAVGLLLPPNFSQTRDHLYFNNNETSRSVKYRVDFTHSILRKTFWDDPVENLDVDVGAHLWWAPEYTELDMGMLVDVAIGRHWFQQRPFVHEYFFEEHHPTFAFNTGWWANHTGLQQFPDWSTTFFPLPTFECGIAVPCGGVFARREMIVMSAPDPLPTARRVEFGPLALVDFSLPAPWIAGEPGYLEAPFDARDLGGSVRVVAFLSDETGVRASWDLPLGHGIYPFDGWTEGQIFRMRFAVPVPPDLAVGRYDLGFVVLDGAGEVVVPTRVPPTAATDAPRFAAGEVRFPAAIDVVDEDARVHRIAALRAEVGRHVSALACDRAEATWIRLERQRPVAWSWHDTMKAAIGPQLAACWAHRAEREPAEAPAHLARAHRWDPYNRELRRVGDPVARRMIDEGRQAMDAGDWETAYRRFADVLRFAPEHPDIRLLAEKARDQRLGIANDVRVGIGGEDELRAEEARRKKAPP